MKVQELAFHLPNSLHATTPPERRGIRRDYVKLMVINRHTGDVTHDSFYNLVDYLQKGDLLIVNASRTVPAVLKAQWNRGESIVAEELEIKLAHRKGEATWEVWIANEDVKEEDVFRFTPHLYATVMDTHNRSPFVLLQFSHTGTELFHDIYSLGEPVRYEYIEQPWDLDYYQTVYATVPGSVEMPSAGRAFSWELLFKLQKKGVRIEYVLLHTGLSYLDDKWKQAPTDNYEEYTISSDTLDRILQTRATGGKVIAVGTTVVRAIETAVAQQSLSGWTNLYIDANYQLEAVDGLITGLHEPEASHLDMLSAFVDADRLSKAYREAITKEYLWHEFGDVNLII
ncbi:S-adenosylmethionine:tRNA ribosyltransferase-isomerase [Microbacteriaceae bacterium 4G12]